MPLQRNKEFRILCVYSESQTYTATVFEHLDAFRKYSKYSWNYLDIGKFNGGLVRLDHFDAVVLHYSVRLPFSQLAESAVAALQNFRGLKVLFIQDEYDHTNKSKRIINQARLNLVFSVVPGPSLERIYPKSEFPYTRFVSIFTGYVPDDLGAQIGDTIRPSERRLTIAYRGRPLHLRYGKLGQEKVEIGRRVEDYCRKRHIPCDIAWSESSRIYGDDWYRFIGSTKAMLGSESGSNVFDWDGSLEGEISSYRQSNPGCSDDDIYRDVVAAREVDGLMNQLSPRIFEMAASKTIMVLVEGAYSGVLIPDVHYVPLKKDFSNLSQVFRKLSDGSEVEAMAERAYVDIIMSGNFSYRNFVNLVDSELRTEFSGLEATLRPDAKVGAIVVQGLRQIPYKAKPPLSGWINNNSTLFRRLVAQLVYAVWQKIPIAARPYIKRILGRV
jgi:hypothetical protein